MNKYRNKVFELFTNKENTKISVSDFHRWLISEEYKTEKENALYHLWNEPNNITEENSRIAYASHLVRKEKTQKRTKQFTIWRYAVAAAIILCYITVYSLLGNKHENSDLNIVEHYSKIGEINKIRLPDGTVVETNSNSILIYPKEFGNGNRTVYLSGEANFKVVKNANKPFIVKSNGFAVTALGTEFNVSSYPNDNQFKATLISGSIKVGQENINSEQVLKINEQFSYNRETKEQSKTTIDVDDETAWQRGELAFRGATIQEIIKVLERNYNIAFHYKSNKAIEDKYNFRFKKDTSLKNVLEVIKNVADNFEYKLTDEVCYINIK